jgi:hypothetical protein
VKELLFSTLAFHKAKKWELAYKFDLIEEINIYASFYKNEIEIIIPGTYKFRDHKITLEEFKVNKYTIGHTVTITGNLPTIYKIITELELTVDTYKLEGLIKSLTNIVEKIRVDNQAD